MPDAEPNRRMPVLWFSAPSYSPTATVTRTPQRRHRRNPARKTMNKSQDPEAAETDQTTSVPAVDLPRLVRLCSDHGYGVSRDHDALYDMAQSKSVVCFVDYHECRDVACTLVRRNSYGAETEIGARGLTYIAGMSREEFVMQCRRYNVEFIPPNVQGDGSPDTNTQPTR